MILPTHAHAALTAPLARFEGGLVHQVALCAELETLADTLPARIDTRAARWLTTRLCATLRQCHRTEETAIFPVLIRTAPTMPPILERLYNEHREDCDHARDLHVAVAEFDPRAQGRHGDEVGYMMRCLFVSLRRHLAFDRDVIVPLCRLHAGVSPGEP